MNRAEYDNRINIIEDKYKKDLSSLNDISERLEESLHNLDRLQSERSVIPKVNAQIDDSRQRIKVIISQNQDKIDILNKKYKKDINQLISEYEETKEI